MLQHVCNTTSTIILSRSEINNLVQVDAESLIFLNASIEVLTIHLIKSANCAEWEATHLFESRIDTDRSKSVVQQISMLSHTSCQQHIVPRYDRSPRQVLYDRDRPLTISSHTNTRLRQSTTKHNECIRMAHRIKCSISSSNTNVDAMLFQSSRENHDLAPRSVVRELSVRMSDVNSH